MPQNDDERVRVWRADTPTPTHWKDDRLPPTIRDPAVRNFVWHFWDLEQHEAGGRGKYDAGGISVSALRQSLAAAIRLIMRVDWAAGGDVFAAKNYEEAEAIRALRREKNT